MRRWTPCQAAWRCDDGGVQQRRIGRLFGVRCESDGGNRMGGRQLSPRAQLLSRNGPAKIGEKSWRTSGKGVTGVTTYRFLLVGLSELAQGNRQEAMQRFQQIADEGVFYAAEYEVGVAFRDRMEADPAWLPPWLKNRDADPED